MRSRNKYTTVTLSAIVMLFVAANTTDSYQAELFGDCNTEPTAEHGENNNAPNSACSDMMAARPSWLSWLKGSSSGQFHYIDLLELLTPKRNH